MLHGDKTSEAVQALIAKASWLVGEPTSLLIFVAPAAESEAPVAWEVTVYTRDRGGTTTGHETYADALDHTHILMLRRLTRRGHAEPRINISIDDAGLRP